MSALSTSVTHDLDPSGDSGDLSDDGDDAPLDALLDSFDGDATVDTLFDVLSKRAAARVFLINALMYSSVVRKTPIQCS